MASLSTLLSVLCFCSCLLTATSLTTERTEWGNVRPPRVLEINDTIYVHVVPHTHDDVGWLKTVDEYYYGGNNSIQHAAVQYILDTVIQQLMVDKSRTFIYVEMAFFTRWWKQQNDQIKNIVKELVKNKQFEFVNAGWCMNDEAGAHYNAIIDQMTLGLKFVEDTFGEDARPRVAWQIDPFGHSSEMASIFAMMGFDGLFFARNDYDDKNQRLKDNTMEMVWRPSKSLGNASDLFTGVMLFHYGPPPGFCFDIKCSDPPIQDDPDLFDYNVDDRVNTFIKDVLLQAGNLRTNQVMFTFGSDFQYENAIEYYKNLDKLMKYTMEKEPRIKVFYSTPSRYLDAVNQAGLSWSVKEDDFFPYADNPYAYWTGYFTSRPALKGYVRQMNNFLQICKQLEVMGVPLAQYRKTNATSQRLQAAMGVAQHHDAVSGTEKQHVSDDYAKRLSIGQKECEALIADVAGAFVSEKSGFTTRPQFEFCELLNVSICPVTREGNFNFLVYNPIVRSRLVFLRFPVNSKSVHVTDENGKQLPSQLMDASIHAHPGITGSAPYELFFMDYVPGLRLKTYFVRTSTNKSTIKDVKPTTLSPTKKIKEKLVDDIPIEIDAAKVVFDGTTKRVKSITNKLFNISMNVDQGFYWYNSSDGHNVNSTQKSGAYIFRPNGTQPFDVTEKGVAQSISVVKGDLFVEATQVFNSWVKQSVRLYHTLPFVEFEYTVGPIPINDHLGKEIISRFTTPLNTDKTWYTDANGREMQKRIRNFRPTWNLNNTEPVAGNYYPVNSRIYMRDVAKDIQFTVMNDRTQGGASLNDGQLELMVHRRTVYDDSRGVGEPLSEPGKDKKGLVIRGFHFVWIDNVLNSTLFHRGMGEYLMMKEIPLFVNDSGDPKDYIQKYMTSFTGLTRELPYNVHLLTLQSLGGGTYLLRLEYQFEIDEAPWNETITLSLSDMFVFGITAVKEVALAANTNVPVNRLKWTTDVPSRSRPSSRGEPVLGPKFSITLHPMEIRTFEVNINFG